MKKALCALLLALILAVTSACTVIVPNDSISQSDASSIVLSESTSSLRETSSGSETSDSVSEPEESSEPVFWPDGGNVQATAPDFDTLYQMSESHLYDLPFSGDVTALDLSGNLILLRIYDNQTTKIVLYDLGTASTVAEAPLLNNRNFAFDETGHIYAANLSARTITFYDNALTPQNTLTATPAGEYGGAMLPMLNGTAAVLIGEDSISVTDADGNSQLASVWQYTLPLLSDGENLYLSSADGVGVFNARTAQFRILDGYTDYAFYGRNPVGILRFGDEYFAKALPDADTVIRFSSADSDESIERTGCGVFLSASYSGIEDQGTLRAYDVRRRTVTSLEVPWNWVSESLVSENGYAVYSYYTSQGSGLAVWHFSVADSDEFSAEVLETNQIEALSEALKDSIRQDTGIEMLTGTYGNDFQATDYVAAAVLEKESIYVALIRIQSLLSRYPAGMMREICENTSNGLRIYLCGTFCQTASSGINSAGALAFTENGWRAIAVDITFASSITTSLAHELMHCMEDRLQRCENETGIPYLSLWTSFVPPTGHGFYNSYHDENGYELTDLSNTAAAGREVADDDVWFVDAYSKSHPWEDRARIMENLMTGDAETQATHLRGVHLQRKARYLCAILRACFPSVSSAESVAWEENLTGLNPDEFSDLLVP